MSLDVGLAAQDLVRSLTNIVAPIFERRLCQGIELRICSILPNAPHLQAEMFESPFIQAELYLGI